jgi:hypothetical protein
MLLFDHAFFAKATVGYWPIANALKRNNMYIAKKKYMMLSKVRDIGF